MLLFLIYIINNEISIIKIIINITLILAILIIYKKTNLIYKKYKFESLNESFNNAKNFLDLTKKGILINNKSQFTFVNNPIVSTIIPVYNSQKLINRAIKSIENQNLLSLEIILINDFSSDNTLKIIFDLQKDDPRIKIINNKKNMGILYSRSIGVLISKGKYIFSLDNDDMFLNLDVFSTITQISNDGNFDIVEFKGVKTKDKNDTLNNIITDISFSNKTLNLVVFQPELSAFPIRIGDKIGKYEINSVYLWCKCIKANIYKIALNKLGKEKYSRYMLAHEDLVLMIILFSIAYSYKFVGKYGIYHISRPNSAFTIKKEIVFDVKELYFTEVAIDFAKNIREHKILIPSLIYNTLNLKSLKKILNNIIYKKILFSCLDKVLNSIIFPQYYKKIIIKKVKSLKYIDYPIEKFI